MQNSANPIKKVNTREELAKISGVSHDTIAKVKKIEIDARKSLDFKNKYTDNNIV